MSDPAGPDAHSDSITRLLRAMQSDGHGFDALYLAVQQELRRVARQQRARVGAGETLSTTALVNEAWFKLRDGVEASDRNHFLAIAARAMREILIDHARRAGADKRGGGIKPDPLDAADAIVLDADQAERLMRLDAALRQLETVAPRLAELVVYRYFAGLTEEETAAQLGVTSRTVRRDWIKARALLAEHLDA